MASILSLRISITMPIAPGSSTSWIGTTTAFPIVEAPHYLDRMTDLIDKYQPDLLYTDGHLPFEDMGLKMVSHLYNVSAQAHGGN
jgi:response regulator of citrate/malate metabolism